MTKQSVVGACKVWTKAPQNTQTEPKAHNLQLTAKSVVFNITVKLVEAINQENIRFPFLVGGLPTYKANLQLKKSGKVHEHHSYHWHIPPADVLHVCFTQAIQMLLFE